MRVSSSVLIATCLLAACAAGPVTLTRDGQRVQVGKSDPDRSQYDEIATVEAVHGSGCGGFGTQGSYEGAYSLLRNKAAEKGADYVELLTVTEPHSDGKCANNEFSMRGIAFRKRDGAAMVQPASAKK